MRKYYIMLIALIVLVLGCTKDKNETVPIDMTLKTYSSDAQYGNYPYYTVPLNLSFQSNGTVRISGLVLSDYSILQYEIGDKMASNTTLHIYGEIDKSITVNGLTTGTKIDWKTTIGRLAYKSEIGGFKAGDYHFSSK